MSKNSRPQSDIKKVPVLRLSEINRYQLFFFIFWPFGQMISAVRNFRQPWSMAMMWLFCVYFGLVFVYADPITGGADSARYAARLIELHAQPFSFSELRSSLYNANSGQVAQVDIYQPLLTWLVSLFTGNPSFLFAAFAGVFGFFYVKNLWMIFNRVTIQVHLLLFLFMMSYALVNPLWNINGVRMWTAAQVFLFGNLLYFLYDDKRGLLWSTISVLFHFSFMFPITLLLVWQFLPRKLWLAWLLFGFYIGTSFVNEIDLFEIRNFLSFLPDVFQPRVSGYTNEVYAEGLEVLKDVKYASPIFIVAENSSRFITYAWIILAFTKRKEWKNNYKTYYRLFLFTLFLGGFANLASNMPSGGRFVVLSNVLFYALFVLLLGKNYLQVTWLKFITLPLLSVAVIFNIRRGFDFIGILTVAGNPLIAPLFDTQTPLIDFVKQFF